MREDKVYNKELTEKYRVLIEDFFLSLRSINKYSQDYFNMAGIISHVNKTSSARLVEVIIKMRIDVSEKVIDDKTLNEFLLSNEKGEYFNKLISYDEQKRHYYSDDPFVRHCIHVANTMNKQSKSERHKMLQMTVLNLISLFETLLSNLATYYFIYVHKDESQYSNKKISFSDIQNFQTIKEIKEFIISKHVTGIMHGPFKSWFYTLINIITRTNKNDYLNLEEELKFIESFFYKRNIMLHNQGIVNHEYIKNVRDEDYEIGQEINISVSDISSLSNAIYKIASWVIIHALIKIENSLNLDMDYLLQSLNSQAVELINEEHYEHAEIILEMIIDSGYLVKDSISWRIIFYNLLLSTILSGNERAKELQIEYDEIINNHESLRTEDFFAMHIFKYGLEPAYNITSLIEIIEEMTENSYEQVNILLTWPMFKLLESDDEFIDFRDKLLYPNK